MTDNPFEPSTNKLRRHTLFSLQDIVLFSKELKIRQGFNRRKIIEIPRAGDLVNGFTFIITLPENEDWVDDIELAMIKSVKLVCAGLCIDEITNNSIYQHHVLCNTIAKRDGNTFYLNVPFYIDSYSHAIPMIALCYQYITIDIEFETLENLVKYGKTKNQSVCIECCLFAKYIYLGNAERRRFVQVGHEYLITQNGAFSYNIERNKNIKKIDEFKKYFLKQSNNTSILNEIASYLLGKNVSVCPRLTNAKIEMKQRIVMPFCTRYFNIVVKFPRTNVYFNYKPVIERLGLTLDGYKYLDEKKEYLTSISQNCFNNRNPNIYAIPLCLDPVNWNPSGTINFDKVNDSILNFEYNTAEMEKYGNDCELIVTYNNYNVLRVLSGMAGLCFM